MRRNLATGPEHLATTADRVWSRSAPAHVTMGVPPSVVARTASEIGCDLWVTLGAHLSQAGMDAFAREIAAHQPAASVVASVDPATAELVAEACATSYFRPYTNTDVIGTELGGAVKNVVALAVGMAEGMGMGDNTKASVITRGLAETTRLAVALGGRRETMAGLAGMGDLIATCSSPLSRNHTAGHLLGQGHRRIAFVGGPRSLGQVRDRLRGARSAVRSARLPSTALTVLSTTGLSVAAGRQAAERTAGRDDDRAHVVQLADGHLAADLQSHHSEEHDHGDVVHPLTKVQ